MLVVSKIYIIIIISNDLILFFFFIIVNCQKACKKCDEGRACQRCLKLGIADTCVDSPRKERLKGVKRGPYKKRQKQQNGIKDQTENKAIQQPYESAVVWDPIQPSSSDLMMLSHDTNGYYSSPIPTQSSFLDNTSPLSLSEHYTSPLQSSSLSTSPASSTMILPQDTLQSLFTMEDMNLSVPIAYDPIYPSQQSISPSSSPVASLTWSTSSPTTTSFIPHLTQSIYQPSIIQQQPPKELYQQSNEQYPWYWDPSYDWSSTYSQPFM
ncbi:uncharacterized protein BX664DRAFT_330278 [Halteromyces radiatus]|uniref:uncharacterized protein n=1 Tax=Halteromyces radiatus TaxID=101107 RepID=UPI002220E121|nr:uncharacterized protein BX664DRAFT_330278 [Halteromyces radiatus]KAI8093666.1 hypothetical protein BX664DRAFT_330278 [Halteromyces radiatus]